MLKTSSKTVMVVAGGTGGHIFPGIAVAKLLEQRGWQVIWVGTSDRMEARIVPQQGFDIEYINVSGVRGNGLKKLVKAPMMVLHAVMQAKKLIKQYKPDVMLGMGGYVTGPCGVAAKLSKVPLLIHEQNAVAGFTNKMLAKIADQVLLGFPNIKDVGDNAIYVGNPVRAELIAEAAEPVTQALSESDIISTEKSGQSAINVLVVGGSLGAKVLNDSLPRFFSQLPDEIKVNVWHQVGKGNQHQVSQDYQNINADIQVNEFIDDMSAAYQWADVVICRAGALTVSEVAAAGVAAVFVPLPHAVDDHQTANANWLVENDAGVILPQSELLKNGLNTVFLPLLKEPKLIQAMGKKAKSLAVINATETVADICEQYTRLV
ncbi:undecaprenyldiphospho-muramoylpentapeptide beta-N-acetylglucosaminyltransferase [Flocculibacter collagenilyticus]|uniref:undecaprenyldiphospho-muramoylpentapeptide beta-N-acetylglucosaminyltransferase n=1 Tax=Flocculibacter collagenilyticus TaxID=2744479 RepID=UPI0018F2879C|nr:undecaprenyldiphospho-muramoylpentapeptide beta-N-acetylglucosaminyltransferase [Flocculibacter collagenilyticus]